MDIMATEQYIVEDTLDQEIEQIANEIAAELDDEVVAEASTESPNKTGGSDAGEAPEQGQVGKTKEPKGKKLTKKKVKAGAETKGQGEDPAEAEVYEEDEAEGEEVVNETPQTKQELIRSIFETLKDTDGDKLAGAYSKLMSALLGEESEEDSSENVTPIVAERKVITSEDIDISEDLAAIFGNADNDLSEEFKSQVQTIFEAAVVAKINSELETLEDSFAAQLEESVNAVNSEVTDKVDTYLSYVVEEWVKENELAIDRGIKAEITEEFIGGLKQLFEDHYIDVPEDKVDVVDSLADRVEDLESKLNEQIESNVNLSAQVKDFQKSEIIGEISGGLTDIEGEKLKGLSEGVGFEDVDQYRTSLETIKENYFSQGKQNNPVVIDEESEISEDGIVETASVTGPMAAYVNVIGKTIVEKR
jgi:hypothetical protein